MMRCQWRNVGWLVAIVFFAFDVPAHAQGPPQSAVTDWIYYNNTGWMAYNRGNLTRAGQAFRMAIEAMRPYEATQRDLMARSNVDFARVLVDQKRYNEAEPLARWALVAQEADRRVKPGDLAKTLVLVAKLDRNRRRDAEAESHLKRAIAIQEQESGMASHELPDSVSVLGDVCADQGKLREAEVHYLRALSLRDEFEVANQKEAEELDRRATLIRAMTGAGGTLNGRLFTNINTLLQAERVEAKVKEAADATNVSPGAATTTEHYAAVLRRAGRNDEAARMDERARAIRDLLETRAARNRPDPLTHVNP